MTTTGLPRPSLSIRSRSVPNPNKLQPVQTLQLNMRVVASRAEDSKPGNNPFRVGQIGASRNIARAPCLAGQGGAGGLRAYGPLLCSPRVIAESKTFDPRPTARDKFYFSLLFVRRVEVLVNWALSRLSGRRLLPSPPAPLLANQLLLAMLKLW